MYVSINFQSDVTTKPKVWKSDHCVCWNCYGGCWYSSKLKSMLNNVASINEIINLNLFTAFDMSGGYFNPVLATALQYNCGEVSKTDHFLVYWAGSIGGSVLSVLIWHSSALSRSLLGDRPKYE